MEIHTNNDFLSGLRWVAMGRLFTQLINWSMTFFVLRLLSPSDYGLVALSTAITALFGFIAEFGFGAAITQAKVVEKHQLASLFGFALFLNLTVTLLAIGTAPLVSMFYSESRLTLIIQVAALQFLIAAMGVLPDTRLRREMRFQNMAKIEFAAGVAGGVLTLAFAYGGLAYWSLVLGTLCGSLLRTLLLHFVIREWVWPSLSIKPVRELVTFGGLTMLGRIVGHFMSQIDILIAGAYLGRDALGIYSVAMQLASMPLSKAMGVVNQVAFPAIARMKNAGDVSGNGLLSGGKMIAYLLFPVLWGLAAVAPFIVTLLMGEKWEAAILPLQLVCLALPIRGISTLLTTAVSALGRADVDLRNNLTGILVLPPCFFAGIQYGVKGLAIAWLIGIPIMVFLNVKRSKKILGFSGKDLLIAMSGPLLTSVIMVTTVTLFSFAFQPNYASVLNLIGAILVGILSYSGAFFLVDPKAFLQFTQIVTRRSFA